MVTCKNCGIELTEDHVYCPHCGCAVWGEEEEDEEEDLAIFEEGF